MTYHYFIKIIGFFLLFIEIINTRNCNHLNRTTKANIDSLQTTNDLSEIIAKRKLVAIVDNSTTSYFIYKGEPMGYEYELLHSYAKSIDVELKIIVAKNLNEVLDQLARGEADIVCANLTVTEERLKKVNFSKPLMYTRQVLVQKKPLRWQKMTADELDKQLIRSAIDLSGKEVHVRKSSSYYSRLINLQSELGSSINIIEAPGQAGTEELIGMVASGKIPLTVADENVAMVNQTYYSQIDVRTAISFPQKIAWAVNKNTPDLLNSLNKWIELQKGTADFAYLYVKYFKNPKERNNSEYASFRGNKISPYDDMIIAYSREIGWDWRLLASMIYQESRFDPNAESWAGACGLMQMTHSTAQLYGLDTCAATPIQSIDAGTKHIIDLDNYWKKILPNSYERTKFVLASYNAGLGHVIDARKLAEKYGYNPNLWTNNVEKFILLKSKPQYYNDPVVKCGYCRGNEPYNYVRKILERYEHYVNVIPVNNV